VYGYIYKCMFAFATANKLVVGGFVCLLVVFVVGLLVFNLLRSVIVLV